MVARVYGRFVPNSQERDRWESIAAALDKEKWSDRGALGGAANEKALELGRPRGLTRLIAGVGLEPTTPHYEASDSPRTGEPNKRGERAMMRHGTLTKRGVSVYQAVYQTGPGLRLRHALT